VCQKCRSAEEVASSRAASPPDSRLSRAIRTWLLLLLLLLLLPQGGREKTTNRG